MGKRISTKLHMKSSYYKVWSTVYCEAVLFVLRVSKLKDLLTFLMLLP